MGTLARLLQPAPPGQPFRRGMIEPGGLPMDSAKARSLLVIMMFLFREPKVPLWPCPHAEGTGDVIEAVLCIGVPRLEFGQ
eukprot:447748-Pyramimonas_sp.AAC.1